MMSALALPQGCSEQADSAKYSAAISCEAIGRQLQLQLLCNPPTLLPFSLHCLAGVHPSAAAALQLDS